MQILISATGLYLGKAILLSGLLYTYYHFLLRDKQTFAWNRFYLLGAAALSVLVPFLHIPVHILAIDNAIPRQVLLLQVQPGQAEQMVDANGVHPAAQAFPWNTLLLAAYGTVVLVLLGLFAWQLIRISRLLHGAERRRLDSVVLVPTDVPGTPFSFFRWIFWDRQLPLDSEAGKRIFRHELAHVQYRHSLDKISLELLCIFLFPVFPLYLIRKELQLVHEYQADQEAAGRKDVDAYAVYLLQHALRMPGHSLAHAFHQHPLARRIAMIHFLPTLKRTALTWTRWMSLPLFLTGAALCAFTLEHRFTHVAAPSSERVLTVVIDAGHGGTDDGAVSGNYREKDINLALAKEVAALAKDYPVRVLLSRDVDSLVSIDGRIQFATDHHADLFVSLHTNLRFDTRKDPSSGMVTTTLDPTWSGIQNFVSRRNAQYDSSIVLGSLLAHHLDKVYPTEQVLREQSRGIGVLSRTPCPSVLIECGFISNPKDAAFMSDPAQQQKIGRQILESLVDYSGGAHPKPLSIQHK